MAKIELFSNFHSVDVTLISQLYLKIMNLNQKCQLKDNEEFVICI